MPTTPYAKVLSRINGGGLVSGPQVVAAGDVVQLVAESTVGWEGSPAPKWEIFDYPIGMAQPSGWSTDSTGVYFFAGTVPTTFTVPAEWGKILPRLTVDGGSNATLVDEVTTSFTQLSPVLGLHDLAFNETIQFGTRRQWVEDQKKNLRLLDAGGGGGNFTIVPVADGDPPSTMDTGKIYRVDTSGAPVAPLTMPPSPSSGKSLIVKDGRGAAAGNNIPVVANAGQDIEDPNAPGTYAGVGGTVNVTVNGAAPEWFWSEDDAQWMLK
jgi:hypothetical protein